MDDSTTSLFIDNVNTKVFHLYTQQVTLNF